MNKKTLQTLLFTLSALLFVAGLLMFALNIMHMHRTGEFRPHRMHRPFSGTSTPDQFVQFSPNDIRDWMTFSFIDQALELPPAYLQTTLHIESPTYPNLSIRKAAGEQATSSAALLTSVKDAISIYKKETN